MATPDFPSWAGDFKRAYHKVLAPAQHSVHQLELLCASISVDGQMPHRDVLNPMRQGCGGATDNNDGAVCTVRESENRLCADSAELNAVPINDDGLADWKYVGSQNN